MTNLKKIGLTALAGTLAATTFANAGSMSVSGNAIMEYQTTEASGTSAGSNDTDGFVLNSSLVFSGSGELDNGMTVSVFQNLFAGAVTSEGLSLDMGDMGVLHMNRWGYTSGITSIADKIPTAGENVHDDLNNATDENHDNPAVGIAKTQSEGNDHLGWNYSGDMFSLTAATGEANGGFENSVALTISAFEGLSIGGGVGNDRPSAALDNDVTTMFATYTMGPVSVGYQQTEIDATTATDIDADHYGISFAINENFSVSYGQNIVDFEASTSDEESSGFSASYTAGSMSFVLVNNEKLNAEGDATVDNEMVELKMIMAF
ncbi:porin [Candidatus Pelagibacter bacterium]|nr:porin [Candidatus Pelagibacter bacterium]